MRRALLAACCLAAPAAAQEGPIALPTRDVDVTYRSEQAGKVLEQRSRFNATVQVMRLDTPTPGLYMILEYRTHKLAVVSEGDRGVLDMPAPPSLLPGESSSGGKPFTRRESDTVAGLPCTDWETRDSQGEAALTCFTDDGVMLRARRGAAVLAIATRVAYGPIDPEVLTVPPGFNHVARPGP